MLAKISGIKRGERPNLIIVAITPHPENAPILLQNVNNTVFQIT